MAIQDVERILPTRCFSIPNPGIEHPSRLTHGTAHHPHNCGQVGYPYSKIFRCYRVTYTLWFNEGPKRLEVEWALLKGSIYNFTMHGGFYNSSCEYIRSGIRYSKLSSGGPWNDWWVRCRSNQDVNCSCLTEDRLPTRGKRWGQHRRVWKRGVVAPVGFLGVTRMLLKVS